MNLKLTKFIKPKNPKTVGMLLQVSLPLLDVKSLTAKVDTGAFSGSLHAADIKEIDSGSTKLLQFTPHGKSSPVTVEKFHSRTIKSSNGHRSLRYAIETEVLIMGKRYPITITLSDRASMKYPMLIGRKFLRTHGFLVDVSINNK